MFYKELDSIRTVEDRADAVIKQATDDGRQLIEDSRNRGFAMKSTAEEQAGEIFKKFVEEGKAVAMYNYENHIAQAKRDADQMARQAERNAAAAINLIAERIVNSSVDN